MANKKFAWGILVITLIFGMTVTGCNNPFEDLLGKNNNSGSDSGADNNNNSGGDNNDGNNSENTPSITGTWVSNGVYGEELWLGSNGNYEFSRNSYKEKGEYTAARQELTLTPTHLWGENYDFGPYWVSKTEMGENYSGNFEKWGGSYSLEADTLYFGEAAYTKRQ